jgi:hypothetical protein
MYTRMHALCMYICTYTMYIFMYVARMGGKKLPTEFWWGNVRRKSILMT